MPECECGAGVSKDYLRVLAPEGLEGMERVEACVQCSNFEAAREAIR